MRFAGAPVEETWPALGGGVVVSLEDPTSRDDGEGGESLAPDGRQHHCWRRLACLAHSCRRATPYVIASMRLRANWRSRVLMDWQLARKFFSRGCLRSNAGASLENCSCLGKEKSWQREEVLTAFFFFEQHLLIGLYFSVTFGGMILSTKLYQYFGDFFRL